MKRDVVVRACWSHKYDLIHNAVRLSEVVWVATISLLSLLLSVIFQSLLSDIFGASTIKFPVN